MRVLVAPDKFKGAMSAARAAEAIAMGIREVMPSAELSLCPMADGGEGTVAALVSATGGHVLRLWVVGPRPGMVVEAEYGMLGDGVTAVIEMSAASGLALLPAEQRNPLKTTTYGTGQLLRQAARGGAKRVILGIGGSATTDAGIGALQGLGCTVRLKGGEVAGDRPLVGEDLPRVAEVEPARDIPELLIACDVKSPLFGRAGAAYVFAPQKGASEREVEELDRWLEDFARRMKLEELARQPGSGAAGGLGFGLCAFVPGARMEAGFELVAEACGFEKRLEGADLCITGEGQFDESSLAGKTVMGVAHRCARRGVKCVVLAGAVHTEAARKLTAQTGAVAMSISTGSMSLEDAMQMTGESLVMAGGRVVMGDLQGEM